MVGMLPGIITTVLLMTLPWSAKAALLAMFCLQNLFFGGFVTVLSWVAVTSAGHTKVRTTFSYTYCLSYVIFCR
jgi:hypothetical protein